MADAAAASPEPAAAAAAAEPAPAPAARRWILANGSSVCALAAAPLPPPATCLSEVPTRALRPDYFPAAPDEVPGWDAAGTSKRGLKARMLDLRWARLRLEKERRRLPPPRRPPASGHAATAAAQRLQLRPLVIATATATAQTKARKGPHPC